MKNRDRVGSAFETLAEGLGPYVDRTMRSSPAGKDWLERMAAQERGRVTLHDPQFLLKAMRDGWEQAFRRTLGQVEKTYVHELLGWRNAWAHNEPFSGEDTDRALDTAERLLNAVNAGQLSGQIRASKAELRRLAVEAETAKGATRLATVEPTVAGLRPWREVALPHTDVQSGHYAQAEFAADLGQVARGEGSAEYVDPKEFFRRTYLTEGLRALLTQGIDRITGAPGAAPVIDLQTNFGGGKTHSLLALWHLMSGTDPAAYPPEVAALLGDRRLPEVRRVVLVGTQISPGQPVVKGDGTVVRTLWGELAWQLGGREAFDLLAEADATSTNPGEALRELFELYTPCLVLIDEWIAYARGLYADPTLVGGTFDTHFSFAQALTEAARTTNGVLLVVSIPASDSLEGAVTSGGVETEVGGEGGREALRRLQHVVRRMDSSWRPANAQESYEIVRRRLFSEIVDADGLRARDLTAKRFSEHYRAHSGQLPRECQDPAYETRIRRAYPIHPELFARLYEDWSTLERFQRTRGVLRLMAKVIHALWVSGDQSPLILPGSIPLDDDQVTGELTRNLEDSWKPIIDTDVDGPQSLPARLDTEKQAFGQRSASRRVARAVFFGSAPTARQANRGIEDQRIRLGVLLPGESPALFGDALRGLAERATYLYVEGPRYWFSVQPTLSRKAADVADRIAQRPDDLHAALSERVRELAPRGAFAAVHVGATLRSGDVPDEARLRLVVVPPTAAHRARSEGSEAAVWAREVLLQRGAASREHRNMLVFLAADVTLLTSLEQSVAHWLAWREVCETLDAEQLTQPQVRQARERQEKAAEAVGLRIAETYRWILVPEQTDPPAGPLSLSELRVEGPDGLAVRAARRLSGDGRLFDGEMGPLHVRMKLDGPLSSLWEDGYVSVQAVWDAFTRYPYLPRLANLAVLLDCVRRGPAGLTWQSVGFAVATARGADGRFLGLVVDDEAREVTMSTLLVWPDLAAEQIAADTVREEAARREAERLARLAGGGDGGEDPPVDDDTPGPDPDPVDPDPAPWPSRFTVSARLDTERLVRQFGKLNTEVISHLVNSGAEVEVVMEIRAIRDSGFDEQLMRTVGENAKALKMIDPEFRTSG